MKWGAGMSGGIWQDMAEGMKEGGGGGWLQCATFLGRGQPMDGEHTVISLPQNYIFSFYAHHLLKGKDIKWKLFLILNEYISRASRIKTGFWRLSINTCKFTLEANFLVLFIQVCILKYFKFYFHYNILI